MARQNRTRTAAGSVLARDLHIAAPALSTGYSESARDVQHPVPGRLGSSAHAGRRLAAYRSPSWIPGRAAHLGSAASSEPSLIMPAIIILLILKEQLRLVFGATPSQNQLTCPPKTLQNAANRAPWEIRRSDLDGEPWSSLFAIQQACFDQSLDGTVAHAAESSSFVQADPFRIR